MLPTADEFGAAMEELGVGRDDRIIVYDNSPTRTAARGWFMFRHFGAERVAILDGGFQKWLAEGRPTESGEPPPRQARFDAHRAAAARWSARRRSSTGSACRCSTRAARARFEGTEPDPRPDVAAGHIPGAQQPAVRRALQRRRHASSRATRSAQLFAAAGVDPDKPFVASCGSGVTANSLIFAAHLLGNRDTRLYDGSWSEWGADPATPKETGPA